MGGEITIHTGGQGASTLIHIDWFDENGVHQTTELEVLIRDQDKPRTLEIRVNDVQVAVIVSK